MNVLQRLQASAMLPDRSTDAVQGVIAASIEIEEDGLPVQSGALYVVAGPRDALHELVVLTLPTALHLTQLFLGEDGPSGFHHLLRGRIGIECRLLRITFNLQVRPKIGGYKRLSSHNAIPPCWFRIRALNTIVLGTANRPVHRRCAGPYGSRRTQMLDWC